MASLYVTYGGSDMVVLKKNLMREGYIITIPKNGNRVAFSFGQATEPYQWDSQFGLEPGESMVVENEPLTSSTRICKAGLELHASSQNGSTIFIQEFTRGVA